MIKVESTISSSVGDIASFNITPAALLKAFEKQTPKRAAKKMCTLKGCSIDITVIKIPVMTAKDFKVFYNNMFGESRSEERDFYFVRRKVK